MTEDKNSIFEKSILASFCCWVLVSIYKLPFYVKHSFGGFGWDVEGKSFGELQKEIIELGLIKWIFKYLFAAFYSFFDIIVLIFIFIGFYLGLKFFYKNKFKFLLFVLPLLLGFLGFFFTLLLGTIGTSGIETAFAAGFTIAFIGLPYLFFTFIVSLMLFFKKERFLFRGVGVFFFIFLLGVIGFGVYIQMRSSREKEELEVLEKSLLQPLKEEAINSRNLDLCYKIKKELKLRDLVPTSLRYYIQPGATRYWSEYYQSCIEEIAVKLRDKSICEILGEEMRMADGTVIRDEKRLQNCYKRVFLNTTDLCKEFLEEREKEKCIKNIALTTLNGELCVRIYDVMCIAEIAKRTNNPDLCRKLIDFNDYLKCLETLKK